jgi:hemerythrin-like domain-containing protein
MSRIIIIEELSEDHGNIARILNLLEAQLAAFRADRDPDYTLMSDAMHYIIHYQDLFHHPKEDIMLGKLTTRDPGAHPIIGELSREHAELAERGKQFLELLLSVESEEMITRAALESAGQQYIALLRGHIRKEESELFPRALTALQGSDWRDINEQITSRQDPIFGGSVEQEYRALYDYLKQQGR